MVDALRTDIAGGSPLPEAATKGKRFLAALVDLIVIPILLGVVFGLILFAAPVAVRNVVLVLVNILWMTFKDLMWDGAAPGKKMAGLRVISTVTGQKITIGQAVIRNILLIFPFVLVVGYIVEIIVLAITGERLGDKWAKTKVVMA